MEESHYKSKSSDIIDAMHFRNPCPGFDGSKQPWIKYLNLTASEDCLNLNIWVPSVRGPGRVKYAKNGIPVLVWIYGGGFLYGANADPVYDGQAFAENYGVIVVNMNYRLGALGFMASTKGGSDYGLRDQNLALKFVKQNIANFGGNPNQITIFGQSAGAMSVLAQIASPQSTGLFQRALSFSPVALSCRDLSQYDRHTNYFFKSFGCKIGNYTCMRDVPFDKILKKQTVVEYIYALKDGKRLNYLEWGPACDVDFLPTDPTTFLLKNHSTYSQYLDAIVVGNVQDEMAAFVPTLLNSTIATDILFDFFWSAELSHGVSKLYDVDPDTGSKLSGYEKVMVALSDYLVNCYTRHLARGIVSSATDSNTFQTYLYLFQHTPSPGANVVFRNMKECAKYPCHASDNVFNFDSVRYIKGLDFRPNFTAFESSLSNAMMSSVADFATGRDCTFHTMLQRSKAPVGWQRQGQWEEGRIHDQHRLSFQVLSVLGKKCRVWCVFVKLFEKSRGIKNTYSHVLYTTYICAHTHNISKFFRTSSSLFNSNIYDLFLHTNAC